MLSHDEADRALLANVSPADHQNPTPEGRYNLVVIGAGTAGLVTAAGAAGLGARVALIERAHLGGDCLNVGCVPSKALISSAHAIAEARRADEMGIRIGGAIEADFPAIMRRMREVRARISPMDSVKRFRDDLGVDVYLGSARFTGEGGIEVDGRHLEYKNAVVATGARAYVPPIPGIEEVEVLTNESIFDLEALPERLLILGGGPIGAELAQAFARFGSKVTVVEKGDQFLAREDADAAALLRQALAEDGVDIRLGMRVARLQPGEATLEPASSDVGDAIEASAFEGNAIEKVPFDRLLVAVGRAPNVDGLGLEQVGVEYDPQRGIRVDDHMRTTGRRIFAAGDVCMAHKFTHAAEFAARIVIQNALFFGRKKLSALTIPWCTYTAPEIAHVGLYPHEAEARGIAIDTYTHAFADVDRAIAEGRDGGFVKVHTATGKDRILGATIVGRDAGDLISEISVAMAGGVGLGGLTGVIHPYPTRADAIRQVGNAYMRTRLSPGVARLFERVLAWRR